ncbi:MAG: tRNA (guanosine(37)-N1)-methyltransferase TrmD [Nitrospiraceae bacterium]|nr:MAG: tRNA (guanosine(37)-N1)-methyltransferase TrmD [Nitrospiraceae bacterium]
MKCDLLTLFPGVCSAYLDESILKRARAKNLLDVRILNIRDFTTDPHRSVDDYPFGGGAGMVLKPEPIFRAMDFLRQDGESRRVVYLTPQGTPFSQALAEAFAAERRRFVFLCGRYEGIDERVKTLVDEEISVGDYVLTGGELAALVIIDAVTRLVPGALGDERSAEHESFTWGLLEYPHYTRPREFRGLGVPQVLLCGNHREIDLWRRKQAFMKTMLVRPDLLDKLQLSAEDRELLDEIKKSFPGASPDD